MIKVCLAELNIQIENRFSLIEQMCRAYLTSFSRPDITVSVTEEEIRAEGEGSLPYLETLAVYRKISERLLDYDGFLMHGAVLEINGTGVAFLAKSGTGKTTHLRLWQRLFGEKVTVVNGDKPLIRMKNGEPIAYGTPWAGKEGLQTNTSVPLKKICFIERAEENQCVPLAKKEVLPRLLGQVYLPKSPEKLSKTMDLIGNLLECSDCYIIRCNMELSAAEMAYQALFQS